MNPLALLKVVGLGALLLKEVGTVFEIIGEVTAPIYYSSVAVGLF
jgi:hypothetical protein